MAGVHVLVRVRGLTPGEVVEGCREAATAVPECQSVLLQGREEFSFDRVCGPEAQQAGVYESVKPLVDALFEGYNATVFAYGQTGSGKTYTMLGEGAMKAARAVAAAPGADEDDRGTVAGVIPRAVRDIFARVAAQKEAGAATCEVAVSFLEIHNEEVKDLLSTAAASERPAVHIRDDATGGIVVSGLEQHAVASEADVAEWIERGALCRSTAATNMNAHSSRSHAVLTVSLRRVDAASGNATVSKFHLVDLAGSERAKKTKARGARLREAAHINRGLLALGNVINALTSAAAQGGGGSSASSGAGAGAGAEKSDGGAVVAGKHIPYRDSKITRLLQDSLGGNSRTVMIACVSPADKNFEETLNTLRYAQRARSIRNRAVVNVDTSGATVAALRRQVAQLQQALLQAHSGRGGGGGGSGAKHGGGQQQGAAAGSAAASSRSSDRSTGRGGADSDASTGAGASTAGALVDALQRVHSLEAANAALAMQNRALTDDLGRTGADVQRLCDEVVTLEADRDKWRWRAEQAGATGGGDGDDDAEKSALGALAEKSARIRELEAELRRVTEVNEGVGALDEDDIDEEGSSERTEFERSQQSLQGELADLAAALAAKESLAAQMSAADGGYDSLRAAFVKNIEGLEAEVRELQGERTRLSGELARAKAEAGSAGSTTVKRLQEKLKGLEGSIAELRRRRVEVRRLGELKSAADAKAERLATDISDIKAARAALLRKLKDNEAKFRAAAKEKEREISTLRKADRKQQHAMAKMAVLHEKQQTVLKRKAEAAEASNARLRLQMQKKRSADAQRSASAAAATARRIGSAATDSSAVDDEVLAMESGARRVPLSAAAAADVTATLEEAADKGNNTVDIAALKSAPAASSLPKHLLRTLADEIGLRVTKRRLGVALTAAIAERKRHGRRVQQLTEDAAPQAEVDAARRSVTEGSARIATLQQALMECDARGSGGGGSAAAHKKAGKAHRWHHLINNVRDAKHSVGWLLSCIAIVAGDVEEARAAAANAQGKLDEVSAEKDEAERRSRAERRRVAAEAAEQQLATEKRLLGVLELTAGGDGAGGASPSSSSGATVDVAALGLPTLTEFHSRLEAAEDEKRQLLAALEDAEAKAAAKRKRAAAAAAPKKRTVEYLSDSDWERSSDSDVGADDSEDSDWEERPGRSRAKKSGGGAARKRTSSGSAASSASASKTKPKAKRSRVSSDSTASAASAASAMSAGSAMTAGSSVSAVSAASFVSAASAATAADQEGAAGDDALVRCECKGKCIRGCACKKAGGFCDPAVCGCKRSKCTNREPEKQANDDEGPPPANAAAHTGQPSDAELAAAFASGAFDEELPSSSSSSATSSAAPATKAAQPRKPALAAANSNTMARASGAPAAGKKPVLGFKKAAVAVKRKLGPPGRTPAGVGGAENDASAASGNGSAKRQRPLALLSANAANPLAPRL